MAGSRPVPAFTPTSAFAPVVQVSCSHGMAIRIVWASQALWRSLRDPWGSAGHSVRTAESGIPCIPLQTVDLWAWDSPEMPPCYLCITAFLICFSFSKMNFPPGWAWGHFCLSCSLFCLWSQDSGPQVSCCHHPRAESPQQLFTISAHSSWVGCWDTDVIDTSSFS